MFSYQYTFASLGRHNIYFLCNQIFYYYFFLLHWLLFHLQCWCFGKFICNLICRILKQYTNYWMGARKMQEDCLKLLTSSSLEGWGPSSISRYVIYSNAIFFPPLLLIEFSTEIHLNWSHMQKCFLFLFFFILFC